MKNGLHKDAMNIVRAANPEHTVSLRLVAWATLKSARGQTVNQLRLRRMALKPAAGSAQ